MNEEVKKVNHKNLIIGVVVVAVILIVLFIPMIPVVTAYSETEEYERPATYVVDDYVLQEKWWFNTYVQSDVTVRNTDKYGGTFVVVHNLKDVYGLFGSVDDSFYLASGESHTSTATFDTSWGQDTLGNYHVTPPTVIDTRLVEKTKTVYKSIIGILIYG